LFFSDKQGAIFTNPAILNRQTDREHSAEGGMGEIIFLEKMMEEDDTENYTILVEETILK